jgi:chitinase
MMTYTLQLLALAAVLPTLTSAAPVNKKRDIVYTVTDVVWTTVDTFVTITAGDPSPTPVVENAVSSAAPIDPVGAPPIDPVGAPPIDPVSMTQESTPASTVASSPASTVASSPASTLVSSPASTLPSSPASTQASSPATTQASSPASTLPSSPASTHASTGAQNVVYWGQNGGSTVENNDLASYCSSNSGIDIIVLAFLYEYGNGNTIPSGTIGQSCTISSSGEGQQCDDLAAAIKTCQSNGVKMILSLGGAVGAYSLASQAEAETIGQNLWDAYGNVGNGIGSVPRPFGSTFVNGFDFDIESNSGNENYQYLISKLRSNFASDSANTYYITGAPQCPIPEPNMQEIITKAQFDYLWVQFYNNPGCSVNGNINYDAWVSNIANTPSANAKIFIGAPASPLGATGTSSGSQYYLAPSALASLVSQHSSNPAFGGVMMWSAGFSDSNVNSGCTYAQEAKHILTSGSPC